MFAIFAIPSFPLFAHCQVPCGIYNDHERVEAMEEDLTTIRKAMKQIKELASKDDAQSKNQLVRWVMTKEKHAQHIIEVISNYFLTQRVKATQKDYKERLVKHHSVIVAAMKVKQNTETKYADKLKIAIKALEAYYPDDDD